MTIPLLMLLGFAAWTLLLLSMTVGVYRWSRMFCGHAAIGDFPADRIEGEAWYQRSMRAHANCVENLPVFGAIVLALLATKVGGAIVDYLSIAVLAARVVQSSVHVAHEQTNAFVTVRFTFYCVQLACFSALIVVIVRDSAAM